MTRRLRTALALVALGVAACAAACSTDSGSEPPTGSGPTPPRSSIVADSSHTAPTSGRTSPNSAPGTTQHEGTTSNPTGTGRTGDPIDTGTLPAGTPDKHNSNVDRVVNAYFQASKAHDSTAIEKLKCQPDANSQPNGGSAQAGYTSLVKVTSEKVSGGRASVTGQAEFHPGNGGTVQPYGFDMELAGTTTWCIVAVNAQ